jgi:hypothetical protein
MNIIIQLTKEHRKQAEDFANIRAENDSDFYKNSRGAFKREDILVGALGEIGTYLYYKELEYDITEPDFTIHKKKSYDADLRFKRGNINGFLHVKSQSKESEKRYGCSYLFQKTDKLDSQPLESHLIVCCVVDLEKDRVEVKGIYWRSGMNKFLQRLKVCYKILRYGIQVKNIRGIIKLNEFKNANTFNIYFELFDEEMYCGNLSTDKYIVELFEKEKGAEAPPLPNPRKD